METRYVTAREYFDLAFERDPSIAGDAVDQLQSMAAAHATLGRPGPAVETAELAIEVAVATGQRSRADAIRARMREFRRARPPTPGSDQRR